MDSPQPARYVIIPIIMGLQFANINNESREDDQEVPVRNQADGR